MVYTQPEFVVTDFVIFGITVALSVGIGLYYALSGGRQKTTAEYLVGNRQMSVIPVALSLLVSFESSIMMLGFPAEIYVYGIMFWLCNIGFGIAILLGVIIVVPLVHPLRIKSVFESSIMMLGFPAEIYVYGIMFWLCNIGFGIAILLGVIIVVPLVHPLRIKSVFEYFELRYKGRTVRLLATTTGMLYYVFYMGIVLFGPGTALEATTNMPFWVSVVSVALAAVIYTSIGGIKAVIWTDVFQCIIMLTGIFSVLIKGTLMVGGPKKVYDINAENGRLYLFNFDPDPRVRHTFWSLIIGSSLRMISITFNQSTVQRISSMGTEKDARRVLYLTGPAFFITMTLATFEGIVAYAFYSTVGCDPLTSKRLKNPNQILPYMVLDIFRELPGMSGLFMAALFSASLSTLSSGLSSLSAMTVEDYIKPYFKNMSDNKLTIIAKLSVPFYGVIAVAISFMIANIQGPMAQIADSILSAFSAPACGLFLYTIFFPWATKKGAIVGTITAVIFSFWLAAGKNFSKSLKKTPWATMPPVDQCPAYQNLTLTNFTLTTEYFSNTTTIDSGPEGLDKLYSLSYQWIGTLGMFSCIVIAIVTSLIEGLPKSDDIDVRYVLPFFDQFFPFLPAKLRKKLYFGVNFEKRKELLKTLDLGTRNFEKELLPPQDPQEETCLTNGKDEPLLPKEATKHNDHRYADHEVSENNL